ncbi:MAG: preprotein translocase subunit YajC [Nitrospiraceae bacterium]|nr:preprotein translocase subunit YajC [Nitrospiraceae bacterium]
MFSFTDIAWAMGPAQQDGGAQGAGSMIQSLLPLIIIFVIFYFLLIRPQQKRQKEHKAMINSLKRGDKIVTSSGIYGVVESVGTITVTVKIAENVKVKFGKDAVAAIRLASEEE